MSVSVWRIAAEAPGYHAADLSGTGAKLSGGRWNRPGNAVVYAADSIALAALETLVHFNSAGLPLNRYIVRIDIPEDVFAAAANLVDPPVGWDAHPVGMASLDSGDAWLAENSTALLLVPSVIVVEAKVVLINPAHPDAATITATAERKFVYDARTRGSRK